MSARLKQTISSVLSACMLALTLSAVAINPAMASTEVTVACGGGGDFRVVDNEILSGSVSELCAGDVVIPEGVTKIGYNSFQEIELITSISIPASVTYIEDGAFRYNSLLTHIDVDENNPKYSSVTGVLYNKNKSELLVYPNNSPYINFIVPNGVTKIRAQALSFASNLSHITIPESVTEIENSNEDPLFFGDYALTGVVVTPGNPVYSSAMGILFNKDMTELLYYPSALPLVSFSVPESVVRIKHDAFLNAIELAELIIPDSVVEIEDRAFYGANGITNLSIGQNVKKIGKFAFANMDSLWDVTIPNSVESIGEGIFSGNRNLESVVLSSQLTEIPTSAFAYNFSLSEISIPASVTSIGREAFFRVGGLTTVLIPAAVTFIGEGAFREMTNLTTVSFAGSYAPEVRPLAFYSVAPGATVFFPEGAIGFCGGPTWKGLVLPDGTPPCPPNCSVITGGTVTATSDGWTLSWDPFDYKNGIDSLDLFVVSGDQERDWYDTPEGLYIGSTGAISETSFMVTKGEIETLSQGKNLTSFTFKVKKANSDDECFPVSEIGTISLAPSAAELARLAQLAKLAAIEKARLEIIAAMQSGRALTVALLQAAEFNGATEKNIGMINFEVNRLSLEEKKDLVPLIKIVRKYEVLDLLADPRPISQKVHLLVEIGLIPAGSKHKISLASALKGLDPAERSNLERLKAVLAAKDLEIQVREGRLAAIRDRVGQRINR